MKPTKRNSLFVFLLASLVLISQAETQTTEDTSRIGDPIFAARSAYTGITKAENNAGSAEEDVDIAQLSRNRPAQLHSPHSGYSRGGHASQWMDYGNPRHALIGALIGFGLGAALAAKANTSPYPGSTARAVFLIGGAGALIGAAVGAAHGMSYAFVPRHKTTPPSPQNDEDPNLNAYSATPNSSDGLAQARAAQ
jgi:hypothetical protein